MKSITRSNIILEGKFPKIDLNEGGCMACKKVHSTDISGEEYVGGVCACSIH